jgi:hypothetical protein
MHHTSRAQWVIFAVWVVLSLCVVTRHEIWRDEMRALTIATQSAEWQQLPADLKNEGHPIFWYILLKVVYGIWQNPVVLQVVSWIIGAITAALFLFYFRLPLLWKSLYLFSNILFYENTIMCRNYGIASLMIVLFSLAHQRGYIYASLLCIAVLSQTNVVGLIVGIVLFGYLVLHDFWPKVWRRPAFWTGLVMIIASVALFYKITSPDATSDLARVRTLSDFINKGLLCGLTLQHVFVPKIPFLSIVICAIFLAFFRFNWKLLLLMYGCLFAMALIGKEVNLLSMRHLGVFFTFFLFAVQQYRAAQPDAERTNKPMYQYVLPFLLVGLATVNLVTCYQDFTWQWSSSKALSEYLKTHPKYQNAILIAEPDYLVEPIPFYAENKIYLPREQVWRNYTRFTSLNSNELHLSTVLAWKDSLQTANPTPTLLLTAFEVAPDVDSCYTYRVFGQKRFVVDAENTKRLLHLKEFRQAFGDENYSVYEIR